MRQQAIWEQVTIIAAILTILPFSTHAQDTTLQTPNAEPPPAEYIGTQIMIDIQGAGYRKNEKDPIAADLNNCLNKHSDTQSMNVCLGAAYESYDKILNEVYQLALDANGEKTKQSLRMSQRKWLAFRDAETTAQKSYGQSEDRGTILGIAIGYQSLHAIRERISELMFFLGADQG